MTAFSPVGITATVLPSSALRSHAHRRLSQHRASPHLSQLSAFRLSIRSRPFGSKSIIQTPSPCDETPSSFGVGPLRDCGRKGFQTRCSSIKRFSCDPSSPCWGHSNRWSWARSYPTHHFPQCPAREVRASWIPSAFLDRRKQKLDVSDARCCSLLVCAPQRQTFLVFRLHTRVLYIIRTHAHVLPERR
ncbi:hypothetical protein L226DRAFT_73552 [Lentinus tigrinus ALCF2SS1-7]|uniref:uncharacterized protein n=1 Tax=Lentinus tigrinus ALCF2SS1-7 TaxID=1328758 RepID=UPI0011663513|nr:hypothetical protein L226DRAFT_73552 [Lentinus tigrinus ALCF2SS1-7]